MTDIRQKIHDCRKEVREIGFELHRLNMEQRKTTLILVSIERYPHDRMMQAIVDFEIVYKKIHTLNKKLVEKFNKLYLLNVEYSKPELTA